MTRIALLLILSASLLTACKSTHGVAPLPQEAYSCAEWPDPITGAYGYKEVAEYIQKGNYAYMDCRGKLESMR